MQTTSLCVADRPGSRGNTRIYEDRGGQLVFQCEASSLNFHRDTLEPHTKRAALGVSEAHQLFTARFGADTELGGG